LRIALPSSMDAPCSDGVRKMDAQPNRSKARRLACKRLVQESYWHSVQNRCSLQQHQVHSQDHQHGSLSWRQPLHTCCVLAQCCMRFVFVCLSYSQRPNFCPLQATTAGCCCSSGSPCCAALGTKFVYPAAAGKSRSGPLVGCCYCCCCC
jgi:hypothetical protein